MGGELRVFTGGADGTVRMWNLRSGQPLMVRVLQSVAVCCGVLKCVAVYCSVLRCIAVF